MSGLGKSIKNAVNPKRLARIGQAALNPWNLNAQKKILKGTAEDMSMLMAPDTTALDRLTAAQEAANKAMPMPDELELQRARRRAGATSRGGRASTIMSGGNNGQGLGG
jgi:hypothetical protein